MASEPMGTERLDELRALFDDGWVVSSERGRELIVQLTYLTDDEVASVLEPSDAAAASAALARIRHAHRARMAADPVTLPERTSTFRWVDPLHPNGKCTCAGEGSCEWCTGTFPCGCKRSECPGHDDDRL